MKLRHPALVGLAALVLSVIIRVWMRCVRVRFANFDADDHYTDPRQKPLVYTFWHENILFASTEPVRCRVLISQHADGELIARTAHHLKKDNVRGSSTRGGTAAVFEMLRSCATHHIAVTPDGPQGPRRRVQMGVVFLASQSGRPVVPLGVGYSHAWRAKSWDRFAVALPGSVACLVAAPAVAVPKKLSRADLEVYRRRIEASLHWADDAAQAWATTGQRPTHLPSPGFAGEGLGVRVRDLESQISNRRVTLTPGSSPAKPGEGGKTLTPGSSPAKPGEGRIAS